MKKPARRKADKAPEGARLLFAPAQLDPRPQAAPDPIPSGERAGAERATPAPTPKPEPVATAAAKCVLPWCDAPSYDGRPCCRAHTAQIPHGLQAEARATEGTPKHARTLAAIVATLASYEGRTHYTAPEDPPEVRERIAARLAEAGLWVHRSTVRKNDGTTEERVSIEREPPGAAFVTRDNVRHLSEQARAVLDEHTPAVIRPWNLPGSVMSRLAELAPEERSEDWGALLAERAAALARGGLAAEAERKAEAEREALASGAQKAAARRLRCHTDAQGIERWSL